MFFGNSSSENFFLESYNTIGEVKDLIIKRYDFESSKRGFYGIYEFCEKEDYYEENYINDNIKVLDVFGSWANETDFIRKKFDIDEPIISFKLYFKLRFNYESKLP